MQRSSPGKPAEGLGSVGFVAGLLALSMMVLVILTLTIVADPDRQLRNTASAPLATDNAGTGASTGDGGQQ